MLVVNPKTGRGVKIGSKTYMRLVREGTLPNVPFSRDELFLQRKKREKDKLDGNYKDKDINSLLENLRKIKLEPMIEEPQQSHEAISSEEEPMIEPETEEPHNLEKEDLVDEKDMIKLILQKLENMSKDELKSLDEKKIEQMVDEI